MSLQIYFLIHEYLLQSQYLTISEKTLRQRIRDTFQERLYLETVNHVIVYMREELKNKWITLFEKSDEFRTKETAIAQLVNLSALTEQEQKTSRLFSQAHIEKLFYQFLEQFTGGNETLEFGSGQWLEFMRGNKSAASYH